MDRKLPRTDGDITEEKRENLAAPGEVSNGRSRKKKCREKKITETYSDEHKSRATFPKGHERRNTLGRKMKWGL